MGNLKLHHATKLLPTGCLKALARPWALPLVALAACALFLAINTRFNFEGHFEGVYLLSGTDGNRYELKDDLFLGEGDRFIWGVNIKGPRPGQARGKDQAGPGRAYLDFEWDEEDGNGYVRDVRPDGTEVSTMFSRFVNEDGKVSHGLFLGGAMPANIENPSQDSYNNTGMSYFDGRGWTHIWCNANEAVKSGLSDKVTVPADWKFLGSRVQRRGRDLLVISSRHEVVVDNVPLLIKKTASFRAGDGYFLSTVEFRNAGRYPVLYSYGYGDEPWVGDYGTANGDVGWEEGRLVNTVGCVDTGRYGYIGMFNYGNGLTGEGHGFKKAANFIQWFGSRKPDAFFSNSPKEFPAPGDRSPLSGESRFVGLQWGPLQLNPGETDRFVFAVGMAACDPNSGMPVKPRVNLDYGGPRADGPTL